MWVVHLPTGSLKIGCPRAIEASVEKEALPTADSPPWLWETEGSWGPVGPVRCPVLALPKNGGFGSHRATPSHPFEWDFP